MQPKHSERLPATPSKKKIRLAPSIDLLLAGSGRGMLTGMLLDLTPDELLATTRSVRRRLDLTRPVEREVLEECLRLGQQAPTASYRLLAGVPRPSGRG